MSNLLKFQVNPFNLIIPQIFKPVKVSNFGFCFVGSHACLYELLCSETPKWTPLKDLQTSSSGNYYLMMEMNILRICLSVSWRQSHVHTTFFLRSQRSVGEVAEATWE